MSKGNWVILRYLTEQTKVIRKVLHLMAIGKTKWENFKGNFKGNLTVTKFLGNLGSKFQLLIQLEFRNTFGIWVDKLIQNKLR